MTRLEVWPVEGLPEIAAGDDLAALVSAAAEAAGTPLQDGDVVVVTSKALSKAEGRVVSVDRDEAVAAETERVVATRGRTRIVETRHGLVLASAGVDTSNTAPGTVVLLPVDPDASARGMRSGLGQLLGVDVAVVVTDTFGRPWREGLVDQCIGAAGLVPLEDLRGRTDAHGNVLDQTVTAVADEVAAAAHSGSWRPGRAGWWPPPASTRATWPPTRWSCSRRTPTPRPAGCGPTSPASSASTSRSW